MTFETLEIFYNCVKRPGWNITQINFVLNSEKQDIKLIKNKCISKMLFSDIHVVKPCGLTDVQL